MKTNTELAFTDGIHTLVLGLLATVTAHLVLPPTARFLGGKLLVVFVIGCFWGCLLSLLFRKSLSLVLKKESQFLLLLRTGVMSLLYYFLMFDLLSRHFIGQKLQWFFLESLLQGNFQKQSGVSDATYLWALLLISFSFLACVAVSYLAEFKLRGKTIRISFSYFYGALLLMLLLERGVTGYKQQAGSEIVSALDEAILWRPPSSIFLFDQLYYKVELKELPASLDIPLTVRPSATLPHVVFIMAESLRADMLTPEIMPHLSSLAGTRFTHHYSTSNSSHFGTFPVFYGLFPNHYGHAVETRPLPTLQRFLKQMSYRTHVISSIAFDWMEMETFMNADNFDTFTIFPDVEQTVRNDKQMVTRFRSMLKKSTPPQFFYLAFNSTHHNYYFPEEPQFEKFTPYLDSHFDFRSWWSLKGKKEQILNRYQNAAHYVDFLVGELVTHLKQEQLWDHTLLVFFGDHGEELFEDGHFVHANTLNYYQTSAALFIHAPGDQTFQEISRTSSHLDIVPTVLQQFQQYGAAWQKPSWLKGEDLLAAAYAAQPERVVFSAGAEKRNPKIYAFNSGKRVFRPSKVAAASERRLIQQGLAEFTRL